MKDNEKVESLRRYKGRKSNSRVNSEENSSNTEKSDVAEGVYSQMVRKTPDGKTVVLSENLEDDKKTSKRAEGLITVLSFAIVLCIVACVVFSSFEEYKVLDDFALFFDKGSKISDNETYSFGSFDGFVTVGDSLDSAVSVLGLPEKSVDNMYYYNNSYIIVENETVVGYYKNPSDDFRVTVGFKQTNGRISKGDNPARVVALLGSPTYYLKNEWIYENVSQNFEYINSNSVVSKLTVHFDDNYKVSGYIFSK